MFSIPLLASLHRDERFLCFFAIINAFAIGSYVFRMRQSQVLKPIKEKAPQKNPLADKPLPELKHGKEKAIKETIYCNCH